jgi:hypothetical protein
VPNDNKYQRRKARPRQVRFADGSAIVEQPDGSVLILESALAKPVVLSDAKPVTYRKPSRRAAKRKK